MAPNENWSLDVPSRPVRLGIVGTGFQTRGLFLPCLATMQGVQLVGMSASRAESAQAAEAQFGVPTTVGWEELVARDDIEALLIATPSGMLEEVTIAALERGKHVFVETQGLLTPRGADRVRSLERETGLTVQFGYMRSYAPIYVKFKAILDDWRAREPGERMWLIRYAYGEHLMIHLLVFLGGRIAAVQARGGDRGRIFLCEFESGDIASVSFTSSVTMLANIERVEVSSPTGMLAANNFYELRFLGDLAESYGYELRFDSLHETVWNPSFSVPYFQMSSQYLHGTQPELEAFVHHVRHGGRAASNTDTVEHTMYVKSAALAALATGERIEVGPHTEQLRERAGLRTEETVA